MIIFSKRHRLLTNKAVESSLSTTADEKHRILPVGNRAKSSRTTAQELKEQKIDSAKRFAPRVKRSSGTYDAEQPEDGTGETLRK